MKCREFILLLGGAAVAWPLLAHPQNATADGARRLATIQGRVAPMWRSFEQRLHELGYVERQNPAVEFIDLSGPINDYGEALKELIRREVHVFITSETEIALTSAVSASSTLPIVMIAIDYARPS